jgi:glycosyltransferase involved in cell wall biosynthesis
MSVEFAPLKIGYVVKMFPRLSETFILNEMLQLERFGAEITIFSIKKPNEGQFHKRVSELKAKTIYLEDLDPRKWVTWLGKTWDELGSCKQQVFEMLSGALLCQDSERVEQITMAAWLAAHARRLGLNHLHAHFASLPSTLAFMAHEVSGIPFSFTAHAKDIFVYGMEEHRLREKLTAAGFVVTVTEYNRRYLIDNVPDLNRERITVIHNGVDLEQFKPDKSLMRDNNLIIGVGRLVPKKGFGDLLGACAYLKESGVSFRCEIIGDGPEGEALMAKRQALGLEKDVAFLGPRKQDEVLAKMREATVLALPCTIADDGNQDALPTVILEALACGLPVVSTAVSGIPEIIDSGDDGILVEPRDQLALGKEIERVLKSPALQIQFSFRGREKAVRKFDLRQNAGALYKLMHDSLSVDIDSKEVLKPSLH